MADKKPDRSIASNGALDRSRTILASVPASTGCLLVTWIWFEGVTTAILMTHVNRRIKFIMKSTTNAYVKLYSVILVMLERKARMLTIRWGLTRVCVAQCTMQVVYLYALISDWWAVGWGETVYFDVATVICCFLSLRTNYLLVRCHLVFVKPFLSSSDVRVVARIQWNMEINERY